MYKIKFEQKHLITKDKSQVGKYIDIDGDGIVDGIIYADLLFERGVIYENKDNVKYRNHINLTKDTSKNYYISQKSFNHPLGGEAEVITPIGNGISRFYVMALTDVSNNKYCWFHAARDNKSLIFYSSTFFSPATSIYFGSGKANTAAMIQKWNASKDSYKNTGECKDIWGEIQEQFSKGWFLPSRAELVSFVLNLDITEDNYASKRINEMYWTSSLNTANTAAYRIDFDISRGISTADTIHKAFVRLVTTV